MTASSIYRSPVAPAIRNGLARKFTDLLAYAWTWIAFVGVLIAAHFILQHAN